MFFAKIAGVEARGSRGNSLKRQKNLRRAGFTPQQRTARIYPNAIKMNGNRPPPLQNIASLRAIAVRAPLHYHIGW